MSYPAGVVCFSGLLEGPTASFAPNVVELGKALAAYGLPKDLLAVMIEGGRASITPCGVPYPRASFHADPADSFREALHQALNDEDLSGWCSTLRLTEYRAAEKVESLVQLAAKGVIQTKRTSPYSPTARKPLVDTLRDNVKIIALLTAAAICLAWLYRDSISSIIESPETVVDYIKPKVVGE